MQIQCPYCHEWIESDNDSCPHCQYVLNENDDNRKNVLEDEVIEKKMNEYKEMEKYRVNSNFECNMAYYNMSDDARQIIDAKRARLKRFLKYFIIIIPFMIFAFAFLQQ